MKIKKLGGAFAACLFALLCGCSSSPSAPAVTSSSSSVVSDQPSSQVDPNQAKLDEANSKVEKLESQLEILQEKVDQQKETSDVSEASSDVSKAASSETSVSSAAGAPNQVDPMQSTDAFIKAMKEGPMKGTKYLISSDSKESDGKIVYVFGYREGKKGKTLPSRIAFTINEDRGVKGATILTQSPEENVDHIKSISGFLIKTVDPELSDEDLAGSLEHAMSTGEPVELAGGYSFVYASDFEGTGISTFMLIKTEDLQS